MKKILIFFVGFLALVCSAQANTDNARVQTITKIINCLAFNVNLNSVLISLHHNALVTNMNQVNPVTQTGSPAVVTTPQVVANADYVTKKQFQDSLANQQTLLLGKIPNKNISYIALGAALLSIIICFITYKDKRSAAGKHKLASEKPPKEAVASAQELQNLQQELTKKIVMLTESLDTLKKQLKDNDRSVQNKLTELNNQSREVVFDNITNKTSSHKPAEPEPITPPPMVTKAASSTIMYAKYSDMETGGFSQNILHDTQNGERTFEINISGDTATYGVSGDAKAQRYALQNFEYLDAACNVKGTPQSNGRIVTLRQGLLLQSAEGDWLIRDRAEIELK